MIDPSPSPRSSAWRRFQANRPALASLFVLAGLALFLLLWPLLSPHQPHAVSDAQFQPPNATHWCGTDVHGRDLLTRMAYGGRISLAVGLTGAALSLLIGVSCGAVAGYAGGRWDNALMRTVDMLYAIPSIVFVVIFITSLEILFRPWLEGNGAPAATLGRLLFLIGGLGAISWLTMARIVRGQVLTLRTHPFVEASRALGAGHGRVLLRHILPNVAGVILVYWSLTVPSIVLYESFLSYLGLGIQPPMASWGSLIADGAQQLNSIRVYWWLILCPALLLVTCLLALNFLGDGLRDALDPAPGRTS